MKLENLKAPAPNKQTRKRLGRGEGSGLGQQSGRGHKGQKSVSGVTIKPGFEGGQMPLQRRIPKFGFKNPFRKEYTGINLDVLADFVERGRLSDTITREDLTNVGLAHKKALVKILGRGELKGKISVEANAFTKSASEKIEKAGGTVTVIA